MSNSRPHIPFVESGSYPPRPGNRLRPLVDGTPAFQRIGEAVEAARHSVWLTVAFYTEFQMPDGRGTVFDMLDRAVARGLDVRVLFWRPNTDQYAASTFGGTPENRETLRLRGSRFRARWDRAPGVYCHHQKLWLIDAGQKSETTFTGGLNLTLRGLGQRGHSGGSGRHDVYTELTGPAVTDIHHNFVQRWNEASERQREDGSWGPDCNDLAFPAVASLASGPTLVQIQRHVPPGLYQDSRATPGGRPYAVKDGERTILRQYVQAIESARRSIYIENQAVPMPEISAPLEAALKRGVDVTMLVPAHPEEYVRADRKTEPHRERFERIAALGRYENFLLAGVAGHDPQGKRVDVYVHAKAMLIDDAWATIGSCNLHPYSLYGHSELNASFWDPEVVRALRCDLLAEHLGQDVTSLDDRAALALYRRVARENQVKDRRGDTNWQGIVFALDPATYAA